MGNDVILTAEMMARILKIRPEKAHKGEMGHALLMAGSPGMAGCAVLAAEACLRSGVGKLTIHTQEENRTILQTAIPEACLFFNDSIRKDQSVSYAGPSMQSIGIGPGTGMGPLQASVFTSYATKKKNENVPFVVDADAIHMFAIRHPLAEALRGRTVLTPHAHEMQVLAGGFGKNKSDLMQAAYELAYEQELVIVLKGHPTHIFTVDDEVLICPRGNAGMATAGSGDVLTGLITGLLAQGYSVKEAAMLGTWLHATAGDRAAEELGQECMLARDIIRHLPEAFRELHSELASKQADK